MEILFIISFLLTIGICKAQNLVTNPSFEIYDTCPNTLSQISKAVGWYSARPTCDYFNSCAPYFPHPINCASVPLNSFGYRTPASGNGYAGIIAKEVNFEDRECLGSQLISPLQIGIRYYASFKVSLIGQMYQPQLCGINKLGILFSTVKYDSLSPSPVCSNCAQIYSDSVITDSLNWTRIKGSFVADSNYLFISIGRFNFNSLTDSIQVVGTQCFAIYYVDDVAISEDSAFVNNYEFTDINNIDKDESTVCFPNPFHDKLNLKSPNNLPTEISLYDILSRNLLQQTFTNSTTINTEQLANGIYIYQLKIKNGTITTGKIVKQE